MPSGAREAEQHMAWRGRSPVVDSQATDESLMRSYAGGDTRAGGGLFARLAPVVRGFFVRSFGSVAVADDLVQATFLKVHRARGDYDPARPVRPWLFTIAARVKMDELRRRFRAGETGATTVELDQAELPAAGEGAEAEVARARVQAAVVAALAALPESQRTVIQLHRYEGLTFVEIAALLGCTPLAVKLRAFRGYETLRARLRPLVEEDGS
jgi:RNA polymerase sigma factor (sigma-70 family)